MTWLIEHSVRAAALIVVVGAGSLLACRASAHSRMFAWTVVLYIAAAMPLLSAVLPDVPVPIFGAPVIVVPSPAPVVVGPALQAEATLGSIQSPSALPWLLAGYLVVAGFLFTRLIAGMHLTRRVLRRARVVHDATLLGDVQALSSAMQLHRVPRLMEHESVRVPFVCGLFRPALVLPESWTSWDAATRRAVLTHELSHIGRHDLWTMRTAALYRALTWINPMSWWLRRRLETLAERASDEAVLASGVEPIAYAEILVQFFEAAQRAQGRASWQLAMARPGGFEARRRVGRVLNASEGGSVKLGMSARVLVGVAVVLAAAPAMVLSASHMDAIAIQSPLVPVQTAAPEPVVPVEILPSRQQVKRFNVDLVKVQPLQGIVRQVVLMPILEQSQEQETEPWRSTRNSIDISVTSPIATVRVLPKYTPDAMRAKIQGIVAVEVIVSPEGNVTATRVTKSLDKDLGLDAEAVKTAMMWKFVPGTYQGQAIAVRVVIELEFRLH